MNTQKPINISKRRYNKTTYTNNKNVYKMRYIFTTYPYIREQHSTEIANYLRINGDDIDDKFLSFLRTFIVYVVRGVRGEYNHVYKPPSIIRDILSEY